MQASTGALLEFGGSRKAVAAGRRALAARYPDGVARLDRVDGCHAGGVGFNPYHPKKRTPSDYLLVVAAVVVCVALVAWAFLG
jgi:hypothetical protein